MIKPVEKAKHTNTMPKKTYRLFAGLFILLFILLIVFFIKTNNFYAKIYTHNTTVNQNNTKPKTQYALLLMGYGGGRHQGTYLTDTMMVLIADTKTNKSMLISIPRDIWVTVPTKSGSDFAAKINSVYQMGLSPNKYPDIPKKYQSLQGSANLAKEIASTIVGIPIDYYAVIDFAGFIKVVDVLGGVTVNIEKTFDDVKYPIEGKEDDPCGKSDIELEQAIQLATESPEIAFPCRYEPLHFDAGKTIMDGQTALKYVRSRQSAQDGGDFSRAKRQQLFLQAFKEKILSIGGLTKYFSILNELEDNIKTDIPLSMLKKYASEITSQDTYNFHSLVLDTDNYLNHSKSYDGQYILVPNEKNINWKKLHYDIAQTLKGIKPTKQSESIQDIQ